MKSAALSQALRRMSYGFGFRYGMKEWNKWKLSSLRGLFTLKLNQQPTPGGLL